MFVDLVGSTALSGRLDPEETGRVLKAFQNAAAGEITRMEGNVAKYMGDGVLAYFGWPRAHENDAESAVRAGLAISDAVGRLPPPAGERLMVRVGIGKSRVVQALIDAVAEEDPFRIRHQCSPYHMDSALYPAIQQLTVAAGFKADDDNATRLDKLEALLSRSFVPTPEQAHLIAALLGLDGEERYGPLAIGLQQQRVRTLETLLDQLIGLARRKPVMFLIEDAHWIDPTTLEFVGHCLDVVARARVLILMTARPAFEHGFGGHPIMTPLTLNRLGRDHIATIVSRITGGKALPKPD